MAKKNDLFRRSVGLLSDGNHVAMGAPNNDSNGSETGHAHVRIYDWEAPGDLFGCSVALSSDGTRVQSWQRVGCWSCPDIYPVSRTKQFCDGTDGNLRSLTLRVKDAKAPPPHEVATALP
jgi:hypothetical protein